MNRWNEEELTSLNPRKGSGIPLKLIDADKIQLKETMLNTEYLTTEKIT